MIIEVNSLTKKFESPTAVNEINFSIKEGEVFGLLGPNGAGKFSLVYDLAILLLASFILIVVGTFAFKGMKL